MIGGAAIVAINALRRLQEQRQPAPERPPSLFSVLLVVVVCALTIWVCLGMPL